MCRVEVRLLELCVTCDINLIYKDECLFVCLYVCMFVCTLYKSTFLNRSEPNFAHVSPLFWKRPYGMYGPEILDLFELLGPFSPLQNHGHKMAADATVFRDTLISVVPAGVRVTSPTLRCR